MLKFKKFSSIVIVTSCTLFTLFFFKKQDSSSNIPVVAIANYGPHSSLQETIRGIQEELSRLGLKKDEHIHFEVSDVSFEPSLISQMLAKLRSFQPKVLISLTTPVTQVAKNTLKHLPIVFSCITDPVEAGILIHAEIAQENITGTTDKQNLAAFLSFAKSLLPNSQTVGMLYAAGEANDAALLKMMTKATKDAGLKLLAVPIEQSRDIPLRMQTFKNNVDFIYVGVSGPIQPALPTIAAQAHMMNIPVFNADADAVHTHQVLASFGVNYYDIGTHTARMVYRLLQGEDIKEIQPIHPSINDHLCYVSKKQVEKFKLHLPEKSKTLVIVE